MKPLETNQTVLSWIGVLPPDESTSEWKKQASVVFPYLVFVTSLLSFGGSAMFLIRFITVDLEEGLYAVFQVCAVSISLYVLITGIILKRAIQSALQKLSDIYKTRKYRLRNPNKEH